MALCTGGNGVTVHRLLGALVVPYDIGPDTHLSWIANIGSSRLWPVLGHWQLAANKATSRLYTFHLGIGCSEKGVPMVL